MLDPVSGAQVQDEQLATTDEPLRVTTTVAPPGALTVREPAVRVRVPPPLAVARPTRRDCATDCSSETATCWVSGTAS